jgi:CRISPR-associated protein Csb1
MSNIEQFDHYLTDDGVAALVIREFLAPVEGVDGVIFPPTFAEGGGFPGGYNIDGEGDRSVCIIDTVGSQANRIEPIFATQPFDALIPQIVVKAGEKEVNLLDAGHRAGDALVRCTELQDLLRKAFVSVLKGDVTPIAKVSPTSLVFGVWDSRDTQAKLPRLLASTIRAFGVRRLTRSAQYNPPLNYAEIDVFSEEDKAKAEGDTKNPHFS